MQKTKKWLACLLAIMLALTALPVGVLAADGFSYTDSGSTRTYTGGSGESISVSASDGIDNVVFAVEDSLTVTGQLSMSNISGDFQSGMVSAGSVSAARNGGLLTVSGGKVTTAGAVSLTQGASMTVSNGSLSAKTIDAQGGDLTVSGGEVIVTGNISLSNESSINVSGGTLKSNGDISFMDGYVTISGGIVEANSLKGSSNGSNTSTSISITGGIVKISEEISSSATGWGVSNGTVTVNGDAVVFANSIKQQSNSDSTAQDVTSFDKGVVFIGTSGQVYSDVSLPEGVVIPEGYTLTIPGGSTLTIPEGVTLTNNGEITGAGNLVILGDVKGSGSQTVTGAVTKKSQAAAAPVWDIANTTDGKIVLSATVAGQKYLLTDTGSTPDTESYTWTDGTGDSLTFDKLPNGDDLSADSTYYVWTYTPGNDYYADSAVQYVQVETAPSAPAASAVTINYQDETISFDSGTLEVNTSENFDGTSIASNGSITDYIKETDQTIYVRVKETSGSAASAETTVTIPARREAPAAVEGGYKLSGVTEEMQYSADGINWTDITGTEVTGFAAGNYQVRYKAADNAFASKAVSVEILADTTAPTGTITVEKNKWMEFINTITFGIFCKDKYDVTIEAADEQTGIKSIEYYVTDTAMTEETLAALADDKWQTYQEGGFSITDDGKYIIYARITDNSSNANIKYISTNGMILDSQTPTKPTVSGYTSGVWTNQNVTLTVSGSTALSGIANYEYSADNGTSWNTMTATRQTEAGSTAPANVEEAQLTISGAADTEYLIRAVSNTKEYSENVSITVRIETTAPVIEGIVNNGTYCPDQNFTVSDAHLKEVTINGVPAQDENGVYTLTTEGECVIAAEDEAGNSVNCTVTIGHVWDTVSYKWSEDGKSCTAKRTCTKDSTHTDEAEGTVTDRVSTYPTCTEKGITTYTAAFTVDWAQTQTAALADISAKGHDYVHHDAVSAACEQSGLKEHYTCKNCDLIFDENKEETRLEDLTVGATGHTFSAEWQTDAEKHWHECSCGAKTEESNHTFEWKIDKAAEIGAAGEKHEECAECGYAKAAVEIPALKAPEYPPVIDDTNGGKVTVIPENPQAGDTVTITAEPEDGKEVDKVVVTDENGREIPVTDNGDGSYTFVQPDSEVTVKVTFKAEETKPSTEEKSPQTGDGSVIMLWLALMAASGSVVLAVNGYNRKKKKAE